MKKSNAKQPKSTATAPSETAQTATPSPPDKTRSPGARTKRADGAAKMSGLDAAAKVLTAASKPMGCTDLTKAMLSKGLWKTGGKTPAATISAAILREIRDKGKESRFRKTGRGLFSCKGTVN